MEKQDYIQKRTPSTTKDVNNIIVRTPNFIGDSIMSTPAIQLLLQEYPKANLTILCREHTKDIFINHPSLNRIIIDRSKNNKNRILATQHNRKISAI